MGSSSPGKKVEMAVLEEEEDSLKEREGGFEGFRRVLGKLEGVLWKKWRGDFFVVDGNDVDDDKGEEGKRLDVAMD